LLREPALDEEFANKIEGFVGRIAREESLHAVLEILHDAPREGVGEARVQDLKAKANLRLE